MACRIPVVTSNIPELDEIVGDAGVRVDPQNAEAMGEAVCAILDSGDLRASLVEKGLERSKQFSWEWCAREALAIYEELARG
jgi:glycosyltransferase involved in cell wall biosynthesis